MTPTFRLLLVLLLAASLPLHADDSAEALVQRMVRRDKVLSAHRAQYTYTVEETRQKLDGDGKVVDSEKKTEKVRGDQSPDYGTRDPASPAAAGHADMEAELKKASREEPFNILQIVSHYRFENAGDEVVDGVPCRKVRFSPKGGQPYRNREEKVANELAGYLWIAQADDALVRNVGKLTKPVPVAWFFATLREMEFSFDAAPLPNGEMGPAKITYRFRVQVPFSQIHERHVRVMRDYVSR